MGSARQRDLFPLPASPLGDASFSHKDPLVSRKVCRRVEVGQHQARSVAEAVSALNFLAGVPSAAPHQSSPMAGHSAVRKEVAREVFRLGRPPAGMDPAGAFGELRGASAYEDPEAVVAPFVADLVSLPPEGSSPVPLGVLLGSGGASEVEGFCNNSVVSSACANRKLGSLGLKVPYVDPVLKQNPKLYHAFVRRLIASGVVSLHARSFARESTGVFFVRKKNGRLRLILDARRSNCWFVSPEATELASGSSFGDLTVDPSSHTYVGHVDIQDAFYHLELPLELRRYFALPLICAGDAGISHLDGVPIGPDVLLAPCLAALPMGWSHATYWCQRILTHVARNASDDLSTRNFIVDTSPHRPDASSLAWTVYIDNFLVFGSCKEQVSSVTRAVNNALQGLGLPTHEVGLAESRASLLGWEFDGIGHRVQPSHARAWRTKLALKYLLGQSAVCVHDVEKSWGIALSSRSCAGSCCRYFGLCMFLFTVFGE